MARLALTLTSLALLLGGPLSALAAAPPPPTPAQLVELDAPRLRAQRVGMGVLGSWALVNMAGGGVGWALADDPQAVAFHQLNLGWNTVNLGIAGLALVGLRGEEPGAAGWPGVLTAGRSTERALAFNAGLDFAYMGLGAWLLDRGTRLEDPKQLGCGQGLVLQGAFLAAFDLTLLTVHGRAVSRAWRPWLEARGTGAQAGVSARW